MLMLPSPNPTTPPEPYSSSDVQTDDLQPKTP